MGGHTPEDHEAYLDLLRGKLTDVWDLIEAAPCPFTRVKGIQLAAMLSEELQGLLCEAMAESAEGRRRFRARGVVSPN